ncbi:hypothetical protein [Streptomyces sp. CAI 127]|uniref:hypothetical protein n=1 Tax=Streptomyces sp. CAI 127 TaxID=1076397 RepID=UPI0020CA3352
MRAPGGLPRRAARGLLCGSACLVLGAASHVAAGGHLPGTGVLALLFLALTVQGALLLGGRRRRFDVVVLVLGATQFALHNAFHFLPAPGGGTHPGMPAGHGHGTQHHMAGAFGDPGAAHAMDTGMTLAHAAATLGSALCVLYGERVLRRLGALLAPRRRPPAGPVAPLPAPAVPRTAGGGADPVRGAPRPVPVPARAARGGLGLTSPLICLIRPTPEPLRRP